MKYIPFFGCMMSTKYPWFESAVRRTTATIGMELVDVEGFTCCPDPIYFQAANKIDWYTVLRDDYGFDRVAETVTRPLEGLKVAIHYGCHLLKPSRVMRVDDPNHPTILENLVKATGAEPIHHEKTLLCCGRACMTHEIPERMVIDILEAIREHEADCMGLICPTCFDEFDLGQIVLGKKYKKNLEVPVVYYFQLLGLAQGLTPQEVGLHMHKVKAKGLMDMAAA
jgi:heterodisulfide reductase subunit B